MTASATTGMARACASRPPTAVGHQEARGITKQVVVALADGPEFVFDNGFLSVDKLVAALEG